MSLKAYSVVMGVGGLLCSAAERGGSCVQYSARGMVSLSCFGVGYRFVSPACVAHGAFGSLVLRSPAVVAYILGSRFKKGIQATGHFLVVFYVLFTQQVISIDLVG